MTIQAFRYEIPRKDSENDDIFYTHVPCGIELPVWRVKTLDVAGRLEYERCEQCGTYLDQEPGAI